MRSKTSNAVERIWIEDLSKDQGPNCPTEANDTNLRQHRQASRGTLRPKTWNSDTVVSIQLLNTSGRRVRCSRQRSSFETSSDSL